MAFTCTLRPAHSLASALVSCADAALGRRVAGHRDAALEGQQRGGEDDLARAALQHVAAEFARQHELRVQIDLDDLVPVFVGMLGGRLAQDRAGVVDQDVDGRAVALHLFDERVERLAVAEVAGVAAELAAARGHFPLHVAAFGFQRGAHADDVGAGFGQGHRHRLADAAAGAGDEGGLSIQFELIENVQGQSVQCTRIFILRRRLPSGAWRLPGRRAAPRR